MSDVEGRSSKLHINAPLAQRIEQRSSKPEVVGSNPTWGAIIANLRTLSSYSIMHGSDCTYLEEKGILETALLGDNMNIKYKGDAGVYNSSDECYVATRIFNDFEFKELYSVCSPAQLMRKALSYIEFGCVPKMYSVPVDNMFHDYIDEVFLYIPRFLKDGNGLQSDSEEANRLRKLRKPD